MRGSKDQAACLCVAEHHPGLQSVGYHERGTDGAWTYVKTGAKPCMICNGSGVSPRAAALALR